MSRDDQRIGAAGIADPKALLAEIRDRHPTPRTATAARMKSTERRQVEILVRKKLQKRT